MDPVLRRNLVYSGAACGALASAAVTGLAFGSEAAIRTRGGFGPGAAHAVAFGVAALAALPVGTTVCVVRMARAAGLNSPYGPTLGNAFVGVGVGLAVGAAAGIAAGAAGVTPGTIAAVTAVALTTSSFAVWRLPRHVRPSPVTFVAPDGTTASGLALTVAL